VKQPKENKDDGTPPTHICTLHFNHFLLQYKFCSCIQLTHLPTQHQPTKCSRWTKRSTLLPFENGLLIMLIILIAWPVWGGWKRSGGEAGATILRKEHRGDASSRGEICKKFSTTTKSCPVNIILISSLSCDLVVRYSGKKETLHPQHKMSKGTGVRRLGLAMKQKVCPTSLSAVGTCG
jgi:hypothetical protein